MCLLPRAAPKRNGFYKRHSLHEDVHSKAENGLQATTGLDSTSAAAVVSILSRLTADGVTVALSIHQPRLDIFAMLSHILLLSSEGRMVFSGPASGAKAHFSALGHVAPEDVNIADFLLDVTIRASPQVCALLHATTSPRTSN